MVRLDRQQAVFAVNQDMSVAELRHLTGKVSAEHVLVVTTHLPYPAELGELMTIAAEVKVATFADILSEQEMLECDAGASKEGIHELHERGRTRYAAFYMAASRRLKNQKVCEKVREQWPHAKLFHSDGLGIDANVWRAFGSESIPEEQGRIKERSLLDRVRRLFGGEINLITHEAFRCSAIFLGSVSRVTFRPGVQIRRIAWPLDWGLTNPSLNAKALSGLLQARGVRENFELYTTVHQYNLGMSRLAESGGQVLHILADGHHPSNYPATYIEMFCSGEFVTANPLNAEWFRRHGRQVSAGKWFQAAPRFQHCACREVRCVILALNHAGDWSALINRSDTDILVSAFIELARYKPDLEFAIRLHPTMATHEHEGVGSIRRVEAFLATSGTGNLSISRQTLDEDLRRGDLYFSEYSQVLIDAWARGKLGVSVNLTHRRSFLTDYESLGFLSAVSLDGMKRLIDHATENLNALVDLQNKAVEGFNSVLDQWLYVGRITDDQVAVPRQKRLSRISKI